MASFQNFTTEQLFYLVCDNLRANDEAYSMGCYQLARAFNAMIQNVCDELKLRGVNVAEFLHAAYRLEFNRRACDDLRKVKES
jgi:hypothetical protein